MTAPERLWHCSRFSGAGQTHLSGIYKDSVARGLRWLLQHQKPNGDLRGSSRQYPGMYAHGQATIVLCEAFLMTGDEELRVPAQKAIDFIVDAQYADGGWRYYPQSEARATRGDTSVLGWQLMALQSAMAAELSVPEVTLENAGHFLDKVQRAEGALYAYLPGEDHSAPMTAEAQLCRIYLGWKRNHPSLSGRGILDAAERSHLTPTIPISTTGTMPRRPCTTSAAGIGSNGTCRCAMCWWPLRTHAGTLPAAGRPTAR